MNGPQHYLAAERALEDAEQNRLAAEAERQRIVAGSHDWERREDAISNYKAAAELDMKAAHVHAMLAVAAATAGPRQVYSGPEGTYQEHVADWHPVLVAPEVRS